MSAVVGREPHAAERHTAERLGDTPAGGTWPRRITGTPPRSGPPALRRVVATATGEFDTPCSVCGARPANLLVEWETGACVTGLGTRDQQIEFHASFEWRYYCSQHAAFVPFPSSGGAG